MLSEILNYRAGVWRVLSTWAEACRKVKSRGLCDSEVLQYSTVSVSARVARVARRRHAAQIRWPRSFGEG